MDVRALGLLATLAVATATSPAEAGRRVARGAPLAVPAEAVAPSPAPAPPPPPPPPPALPPAVSPLDAGLVTPSLTGLEESLDLSRMARARVSWTFAVDHGWLGRLDARAVQGLIAACAADPAWRVVEEGGVLVAHRRVEDGRGWSVPRTGFHVGEGATGPVTWRVDLRFGAWPDTSPWRTSPNVLRVDAQARKLVVKAFTARGGSEYGTRASALSVDGPGVAFDVFERGDDDARTTTVQALLALSTKVPPAAWTAAARLAAGQDVTDPPPVAPSPGILVGWVGDQLDVRGWVNPGAPGWTWVRLVGAGGVWAEAAVGAGTRERVGWSGDPARVFWMQGRFAVPAGEDPGADVVAEVWTLPDGGGDVHLVGRWPVVVPAREAAAAVAQTPP